jgi:mRNA interferase MazF
VPPEIFCSKKPSKLAKDSVINISKIITIDEIFLTEKVSKLNSQYLNALDEGLRVFLDIQQQRVLFFTV